MVLSVLKLANIRNISPQPIRILYYFFVMIYVVTNVLLIRENYKILPLTLILLTWRICWAPTNASRWQMGFNSAL